MTTISTVGVWAESLKTRTDVNSVNRPGYSGGSTTASYTITFNANGGTGSMPAFTVGDGSAYALPTSSFTAPSSKKFKAWNTVPAGTGTSATAGTVVTTATADKTYYAIYA